MPKGFRSMFGGFRSRSKTPPPPPDLAPPSRTPPIHSAPIDLNETTLDEEIPIQQTTPNVLQFDAAGRMPGRFSLDTYLDNSQLPEDPGLLTWFLQSSGGSNPPLPIHFSGTPHPLNPIIPSTQEHMSTLDYHDAWETSVSEQMPNLNLGSGSNYTDGGYARNLASDFENAVAPLNDAFFQSLISNAPPFHAPFDPHHLVAEPSSYEVRPTLQVGPSSYQAGPSSFQAGTSSFHAGASSFQAGPSSFQAEPSSFYAGNGYGGGPSDTGLLKSFASHRVKARWDNPCLKDKCLRLQKRGLLNWWDDKLDSRMEWVGFVRRSGLLPLQNWKFLEMDEALMTAFAERWHPETNSFHFSWGGISITLQDIHFILGLPLNRVKARPNPFLSDHDLKNILKDKYNLSSEQLKLLVDKGGIKIHLFHEILKDIIENWEWKDDEEIQKNIASAYLRELLGSTLFVDKTSDSALLKVLQLVLNHNWISGYVRCAAALANIFRQLRMASRAEASQLGGCLCVLHNFVWKYFPGFRGHLNHDITQLPGEQFQMDRGRNRNRPSLAAYRHALDMTRMQDVNWMPWRPVLDFSSTSDLRLSRCRGVLTFLNIQEAYNPKRWRRQYGWHQSIPEEEVIEPVVSQRGPCLKWGNTMFNSTPSMTIGKIDMTI